MSKTILFQFFQFSIITLFTSIWPINRILSGATTPGQNGPGSNGNEEVLRIRQSSSIIGTSASDCLVSYTRHSLEKSYLTTEMQSVYSKAPEDWEIVRNKNISQSIHIERNIYVTRMKCSSLSNFILDTYEMCEYITVWERKYIYALKMCIFTSP